MADIKKAKIGDQIYDVIPLEEFNRNAQFYKTVPTAIEGGDGYLYPVRSNPNDIRPGFFDDQTMQFFTPPVGRDCTTYSSRNLIDFSQAGSIKEIIETQEKLSDAERQILTTVDNVFIPPRLPEETPEMGAIKEAITAKAIDIDKYEYRFGSNYNNDKRILKKDRITFDKLRSTCKALDMRATLIIEDQNPDVPNPIGKRVEVCITDGFDSDNDVEIKDDDQVNEEEE